MLLTHWLAEYFRPAHRRAARRRETPVSPVSAAVEVLEQRVLLSAPTGYDDFYSMEQDGALQVAAPGVLANDFHSEGYEALTAVLGQQPMYGMVSLDSDGGFTYVPDAGFADIDWFTY